VKVPEWAKAAGSVRKAMNRWVSAAVELHGRIPWMGGHDEGTFTSSWFGFYQLTGDGKIDSFLRWFCDGFCRWSKNNLIHGYYPRGEAHHQPETFLVFLTRILHLDPNHSAALDAMVDMAHHIGNWVGGIPEWYDWHQHRFRSWRLGTRHVGNYPEDYETADHLRFAQIALVTHLATRDERYLEFAIDYADKWSTLILQRQDSVPAVILPGKSGYPEKLVARSQQSIEKSVEEHVAAGSLDMFMDLFEITGEAKFIEPVRKMLPVLLPSISGPYSEPAAATLYRYRLLTGDTSFDADAMGLIESMPRCEGNRAHMLIQEAKPMPHPAGIGRRKDDSRWGYRLDDGSIVEECEPSPASLTLAYSITGEERYALHALWKVAARMNLARQFLRDGRHHGCAGGTVSAIASGHGRCFGTGHITSTFLPLSLGTTRFCNGERAFLRYFAADGSLGLPEAISVLTRRKATGGCEVKLCNTSDSRAVVNIAREPAFASLRAMNRPPDGETVRITLEPGECKSISF